MGTTLVLSQECTNVQVKTNDWEADKECVDVGMWESRESGKCERMVVTCDWTRAPLARADTCSQILNREGKQTMGTGFSWPLACL